MSKSIFMILTIFISTIGYFATDIYLPSMPAMTTYFGTTNTLVQLSVPAYLLPFGLTPLYFGPMSDRYGRRPIILFGLATSLLATACILLATNIWCVLVGRFLQGFLFGAVNVAARTMMTDKFRGAELAKFNSTLTLFIPIVLSLAPPIGGYIQEAFGWRYVFIALMGYQLFVIALTYFFLEETCSTQDDYFDAMESYGYILKNRVFLLYGSLTVVVMIGLTVYLTVSPYIFQIFLGFSPLEYGKLSFIAGSCVILSAITNIRLMNHIASHKILYIAASIMAISSLVLTYDHFTASKSVPLIVFGALFYFFSINMAFANSIANAFMQIDMHYGAGTALITSAQMICSMIASSLVSFLPESDVKPLMVTYVLTTILFFVITVVANSRNNKI